ncbi:hypothetical protein GN956_G15927 [Arapaima gigas]
MQSEVMFLLLTPLASCSYEASKQFRDIHCRTCGSKLSYHLKSMAIRRPHLPAPPLCCIPAGVMPGRDWAYGGITALHPEVSFNVLPPV